jgi:signal transduction histidine kinase
MAAEDRQRFLANIAADTSRLSQLVTRLLDLARADMSRPEAGVAIDARDPILRIADAHRSDDFAVEVVLPAALPLVAVPVATLESVLSTLIENSRQAGASDVTVQSRATHDNVVLEVADNGPGIPEGDRERLFEPFFTSKREAGGTGLGLAIARSLLSASQADIRLMPTADGARFQIILRRA